MHIRYQVSAVLFSLAERTLADAQGDFANIENMVAITTEQLVSSLTVPLATNATNATSNNYALPVGAPYPTAADIQNLTMAIETSTASCSANSTGFINGNSMEILDYGYMNYINAIPSFSQALIARGRAWHPEWNQPVYAAIGDLASAVYAFGTALTQSNVISEASTIRTFTAGGTLTDAEEAWDNTGTLPGKRSTA